MMAILEEIMLYAVATLAVVVAVAVGAFICGTLMGFGSMIARIAFRMWGV